MRCYLMDIDGTLADISHRLHYIQKDPKDWDGFFDACSGDAPIGHMIDLCRSLAQFSPIVFVSGRSERCRADTKTWLDEYSLYGDLYMRKDGDHRPDYQVKKELLDRIRADGFEPRMVFEDRAQVVEMWRENGIPCAQVAEGNY
jgi:hypothetical protein